MLFSLLYGERMFKISVAIKERLIRFMKDGGVETRAAAVEMRCCDWRNSPLKRGAPWVVGSGNGADFGQLP